MTGVSGEPSCYKVAIAPQGIHRASRTKLNTHEDKGSVLYPQGGVPTDNDEAMPTVCILGNECYPAVTSIFLFSLLGVSETLELLLP